MNNTLNMKDGLYETMDFVNTPDGDGYVNEDQRRGETTVLIELINEDRVNNYEIEDVTLITSVS